MSREQVIEILKTLPHRPLLEILLVVFGLLVPAIFFVSSFIGMYFGTWSRWTRMTKTSIYDEEPFAEEARSKNLGETTVAPLKSAELKNANQGVSEPIFETFQIWTKHDAAEARWNIYIDFAFKNCCSYPLLIHDIHARIYKKHVPAPPQATVGYRAEIVLLADNKIRLGSGVLNLPVNEGYNITLAMELARFQGSPVYGSDHAEKGPVRIVFGLFVDYSLERPRDFERRPSIPSDRLYLFECSSRQDAGQLEKIDQAWLTQLRASGGMSKKQQNEVNELDALLFDHLAARPIPRISVVAT